MLSGKMGLSHRLMMHQQIARLASTCGLTKAELLEMMKSELEDMI